MSYVINLIYNDETVFHYYYYLILLVSLRVDGCWGRKDLNCVLEGDFCSSWKSSLWCF